MNTMQEKIGACFALFDQGRPAEALAGYEACLEEGASGPTYDAVLNGMMYALAALGRFDEARARGRELLSRAADEQERHVALHQLGMVARQADCWEEAQALFEQERALILRALPADQLALSANDYELACCLMHAGQLHAAFTQMNQAHQEALASGDAICLGCALRGLGEIHQRLGDTAAARRCFQAAASSFRAGGDPLGAQEAESLSP